jgi:hypothetical protein
MDFMDSGRFGMIGGNKEAVMQTLTLSEAAPDLFRLHIERHGDVDVDENREIYRELERAG